MIRELPGAEYNGYIKAKAGSGHLLVEGDRAPDFKLTDTHGKRVRLRDYKDKHVLLVFLRYSACPWCNITIHRLSMEYPILEENGCEVIAVMQSTAGKIQKNIYGMHKVQPQYPIIPDVNEDFYKQYGVNSSLPKAVTSIKDIPYWLQSIAEHGLKRPEIDGNLLLVPATFLISPGKQQIIHAEYGSSFYDHQTFTRIYEPLIFAGAE